MRKNHVCSTCGKELDGEVKHGRHVACIAEEDRKRNESRKTNAPQKQSYDGNWHATRLDLIEQDLARQCDMLDASMTDEEWEEFCRFTVRTGR
jgi:hypothetical protein